MLLLCQKSRFDYNRYARVTLKSDKVIFVLQQVWNCFHAKCLLLVIAYLMSSLDQLFWKVKVVVFLEKTSKTKRKYFSSCSAWRRRRRRRCWWCWRQWQLLLLLLHDYAMASGSSSKCLLMMLKQDRKDATIFFDSVRRLATLSNFIFWSEPTSPNITDRQI